MFWSNKKSNNGNHRDDLEERIRRENEKYENASKPVEEKPVVKVIKQVSNNGHKKDEEIKVSNNGKSRTEVTEDQIAEDDLKYEVPVEEDKPDIPGRGFLYHAKPENLGEATRLNEREIVLFAVGDTKQSLLKKQRRPVYETFRDRTFTYKVALDGEGRKEAIELKTIEAERSADKATQAFGKI